MDEYIARRKTAYPAELKPVRQEVSEVLAEYLWKEFETDREEMSK